MLRGSIPRTGQIIDGLKSKNIPASAIRERLTGVDINRRRIYTCNAEIVRNIKRVLDIISEWKRHDCIIIFGGGVITAYKKNFEGRIEIKNGPQYDTVLLEYIKELL